MNTIIAGILINTEAAIKGPHLTPHSSMKNARATEIVLRFSPLVKTKTKRNSFHAVIKVYIPTAAIPGRITGIITLVIIPIGEHPSIVAASSISIGTLIGSNITNPMFALGLGAMISSYQVPRPIIVYDLPVKIISGILLIWFLWRNRMFTKKEAATMIAIYFAYILVRLKYFATDV